MDVGFIRESEIKSGSHLNPSFCRLLELVRIVWDCMGLIRDWLELVQDCLGLFGTAWDCMGLVRIGWDCMGLDGICWDLGLFGIGWD